MIIPECVCHCMVMNVTSITIYCDLPWFKWILIQRYWLLACIFTFAFVIPVPLVKTWLDSGARHELLLSYCKVAPTHQGSSFPVYGLVGKADQKD